MTLIAGLLGSRAMRRLAKRTILMMTLTSLALGCGDDGGDGATDGGVDGSTADAATSDFGTEDASTPSDDGGASDGSTPADGSSVDGFPDDAFVADDASADGFVVDAFAEDGGVDGGTPGRTVCGSLPALGSGEACEVTAGSSTVLLRGTVLGPEGIFEAGEVLVEGSGPDGRILCVGCDCASRPAASGATVVSCPEGVISPGLIDGLSYPRYATNAPIAASTERYEHRHDWRTGTGGHTTISTSSDSSGNAATIQELRSLLAGVTAVVASNGSAGSLGGPRNLFRDPLGARVSVDLDTFPLNDVSGASYADCSDYSYDSPPPSGTTFLPVIAEGVDERARNELDCLTTAAGGEDQVNAETAVVAAVGIDGSQIDRLSQRGAAVVWRPRSDVRLYGNTAPVVALASSGVPIALASNWLPTGSMSLLRELACADELNQRNLGAFFSDRELWQMVTGHAARAMGTRDVGILREGAIADVSVFDGRSRTDYRAILDAEPRDVLLVLRGGEALSGDAALVTGLDATECETLDVCGVSKTVCSERLYGETTATILAAAPVDSLGLFSCGAPAGEPTCVPARMGEYGGLPTAGDADGDGIADGSDNCPSVFNPVRPMDGGSQADGDGDGTGDACDPCPADGSASCAALDPSDRDDDGVPYAADNCPFTSNAGQDDMDGDGLGDDCDDCPTIPSPTNECPVSIYDVKSGTVAVDDTARLDGVLVTASAPGIGAFVQVDPADPGYTGPDQSGLFVFLGPLGTFPSRGDRIDVRGTVANFFGQIQLEASSLSVVSSGNALPAAVSVTPAEVGTTGSRREALEGVLVQVSNVTVTELNPAAGPGDTDPTNAFVVDGELRVNDYLHLADPFPSVGSEYTSITGVLRWSNNQSKLEPRDAADLSPL